MSDVFLTSLQVFLHF